MYLFASSFFRRLFVPSFVLIALVSVVIGVFGAAGLRSSYLERTRQSLDNQSWLVAEMLSPDLQSAAAPDAPLPPQLSERIRERLRLAGSQTGSRLTLVARDGTVLADTEADPARMGNHAGRPEIAQAAAAGAGDSIRPSDTLRVDLMYFARRFAVAPPPGAARRPATYFVRLAVHLSDLNRQVWTLYWGLGTMALVSLLGAGLISYYFARHHAAPLVELTAFADALAHGDLNRRLLRHSKGEIKTLTVSLNSMADSLAAMVAEAAKDKAELLTILASMNEGVIATDLDQRILLVNGAGAKLLGFDAAGTDGKRLWEVVRHNAILQAADAVVLSRATKVLSIGPLDGRHLEVTVCTFPTRPGTGADAGRNGHATPAVAAEQAHGLVLVAHDTTQSVQYQDLRKEFVANVSHELRTPLSIIKGFAETLRDGAIADPKRGPEYLRIIEKHVDQLTNLVNDLLELSRLESQPGLAKRTAVDLGAVVRKVGDLLSPVADRKRQALAVEVADPLPAVAGDPDYLERAITNLVDNAVKYTPEGGGVRVRVWADYDAPPKPSNGDGYPAALHAPSSVTVEVSDNGLGIPAADIPRIFERFYRVDRSRSREMGGTGLGLSIVKHVAQSHGGKIDVASTPGVGSTFRLRLPAAGSVVRTLG